MRGGGLNGDDGLFWVSSIHPAGASRGTQMLACWTIHVFIFSLYGSFLLYCFVRESTFGSLFGLCTRENEEKKKEQGK
jgi:hypothetical protein